MNSITVENDYTSWVIKASLLTSVSQRELIHRFSSCDVPIVFSNKFHVMFQVSSFHPVTAVRIVSFLFNVSTKFSAIYYFCASLLSARIALFTNIPLAQHFSTVRVHSKVTGVTRIWYVGLPICFSVYATVTAVSWISCVTPAGCRAALLYSVIFSLRHHSS